MISVKFGSGADDLKGLINAKGRKHAEGEKLPPGEPNLEMYLKLAENFMKKGHFESALYWIGEAADFNSESAVSYYYLSDNEPYLLVSEAHLIIFLLISTTKMYVVLKSDLPISEGIWEKILIPERQAQC